MPGRTAQRGVGGGVMVRGSGVDDAARSPVYADAPETGSGTPEQPKEDLTKRLVGAFRDRMTKEFKGQAKDAVKSLLDMFHQ